MSLLEILIILLSLTSTVASCTNSYYRQGGEQENEYLSQVHSVLYPLTVVTPLIVTVLISITAIMKPYEKYCALKFATLKVEAEIYKYRARACQYNRDKLQAMEDNNSIIATATTDGNTSTFIENETNGGGDEEEEEEEGLAALSKQMQFSGRGKPAVFSSSLDEDGSLPLSTTTALQLKSKHSAMPQTRQIFCFNV